MKLYNIFFVYCFVKPLHSAFIETTVGLTCQSLISLSPYCQLFIAFLLSHMCNQCVSYQYVCSLSKLQNSDKKYWRHLGLLQYGDCSKRQQLDQHYVSALAVAVHMLDLKTNWKHAEKRKCLKGFWSCGMTASKWKKF